MGCINDKYKLVSDEEIQDIRQEIREETIINLEKTKEEEINKLKNDVKELKILYNDNIIKVETLIKLMEDKDKSKNPFTNFF